MKKFLFPTDFSDNAANALNYAIQFINHLGTAQLTILHAYNISSNVSPLVLIDGHIQSDVESEMSRVVNRIQPLLKEGAEIKTVIKKGTIISSITEIADDFDLIIMGTQGASGLKEIFLGSITNGVIKNTQTPVLVIPKAYIFKSLRNIALSLDNQGINDEKGILVIKKLLKAFKGDLMLFHTEETPADKGFDRKVLHLFDNPGFSIDFNFAGKPVNESIEEMTVDYDMDLLCMVKRKRGLLKSLFHQSVTSKEIFHTKIPLLILHDLKL